MWVEAMISITDKRKCSGCKACMNACSREAISFEFDDEGFWYPVVDIDKCIDCGKCEKACPFLNKHHGVSRDNYSYTQKFFAAQLTDVSELFYVSSGGVFQALAKTIINMNGIVYGVEQKNVDQIQHIRATNLEELKKTRRSKYLQSDIGNTYKQALTDLKAGRKVLFSGTGCQIAGLVCFLGRRYENLYTCEVVCHGVPSWRMWKQYRKEAESKKGKKIVDLVFRDKSKGWSKNQYKITYEDGCTEYERSTKHIFHAGYLQGLFYRPSCGECPFASMPRVADITLADFWQYKGKLDKKNSGVSLIAINNENGEALLDMAKGFLIIENVSKEKAINSCRHMDECPKENPYRKAFIDEALSYGYYATAEKYLKSDTPSMVDRISNRICSIIRRMNK